MRDSDATSRREVTVREHHTLGLARRPRGEQHARERVGRGRVEVGLVVWTALGEQLQASLIDVCVREALARGLVEEREDGSRLAHDDVELRGLELFVDGNEHGAAQDDPKSRDGPARVIVTREHHTVSGLDATRGQARCDSACPREDLAVAHVLGRHPVEVTERDLALVARARRLQELAEVRVLRLRFELAAFSATALGARQPITQECVAPVDLEALRAYARSLGPHQKSARGWRYTAAGRPAQFVGHARTTSTVKIEEIEQAAAEQRRALGR